MFEIERIVVVTKKTSLGELVYRLNSKSQAKFYLEQNQVSFSEYEQSDAQYQQAIQLIRQRLPRTIKQQFIDRDFLPTYQFGEHDHAGRVACRALLWRWHRYTACSGGYRARLGIRPPMVHGARTIPVQNIAGQHRLRANRPSPGAGNYLAHARLRCHFQRRHRKRLPRLQFRLYRPRWAGRTQGASDCATLSGLMLLPIIHEK